MENEDVSADLAVNEPCTVYHNRTEGGQNNDMPANADDTESSHLVSTDIHESLHDPISVQGGSLDHNSHTHSELQRHDEGGLQSPPSGRDPTSPPPDYNEIVITEFYNMKGLICRDVQTEPMVCSCMCHAEAAGNRGHCSESARSTGYSPFICDRQTIPTAPFIPDRQTIPTGSYNPGIDYSTGPVFIHDAIHGAQITPPYQVTNTRNFTIDQNLAKRLVILLFVFIVVGAIICVAVIAGEPRHIKGRFGTMENGDVSSDLSVNEPCTVYHNRTEGGQNNDMPANADDTESSHLISTDIHESLHDPISVQGGSLDHSSHTHSELQRHDEGGLQSPPSGRDLTSPPPDYNEIVVTEFYAMKGLICRDVQTEPMVCSCMCHAEAAGNRGHCSESARCTGYSPFICDRQTIPTAPFIPDRQTIPTGSYNPGIGYSTGPVFIHDAIHGAQITPPYQVTNTRNFTIDQKLAKRLVILLFVFIVIGGIIFVAVITSIY